jgi:hypothetical protein
MSVTGANGNSVATVRKMTFRRSIGITLIALYREAVMECQ